MNSQLHHNDLREALYSPQPIKIDNPTPVKTAPKNIRLRANMVPSIGPAFPVIEEDKVIKPISASNSMKFKNEINYKNYPEFPTPPPEKPPRVAFPPPVGSVQLSDLTEYGVDPSRYSETTAPKSEPYNPAPPKILPKPISKRYSDRHTKSNPGTPYTPTIVTLDTSHLVKSPDPQNPTSDNFKIYRRTNPDENLGYTVIQSGDPNNKKNIDFSNGVQMNFG